MSKIIINSKKQINRAGRYLALNSSSGLDKKEDALNIANNWRSCFAYPLNTFNTFLRTKNVSKNSITAQRLKRMPTIIDKLRRYPKMQLTTMQDIAGLRAVVESVEDVYTLADSFRKSKRLLHELVNEKDYIQEPRDEDGYRSLHLVYKYKNNKRPEYNGLFLEVQIRTKLQHIWATAVETMGTFLGQALKSRQGDKEWINFFAVTSSAFAYLEGTPPLTCHKQLTKEETFAEVARMENTVKALQKMRGFSTAAAIIKDRINTNDNMYKKSYYHLIILNSLKNTLQIKAYKRSDYKKAIYEYSEVEKRVIDGEKIEPVLVSAGTLQMLRSAYPNFFLDIKDFVSEVIKIINKSKQKL